MFGKGSVTASLTLLLASFIALALCDTCHNRCGSAYDRSKSCQCNSRCSDFNNCCSDYNQYCTSGGCSGRCGSNYNPSLSCQCNSGCSNYGNCCGDYAAVCQVQSASATVTPFTAGSSFCGTTTTISRELWDSDSDALPNSAIVLNFQSHTTSSSNSDVSHQPFFSYVNENYMSSAVYTTFLDLLDNYDPDKGDAEYVSSHESSENSAFLDAVLGTQVMQVLEDYLICRGKISSRSSLRSKLTDLFFTTFSRSPYGRTADTSGFEHVFVGEYKDSQEVNGFHNWIQMYESEKDGRLNYLGYVVKREPYYVSASFTWENHKKPVGSVLVASSPAYDLALYTLCALEYPNDECPVTIDGRSGTITIYMSGSHLSTAYIRL